VTYHYVDCYYCDSPRPHDTTHLTDLTESHQEYGPGDPPFPIPPLTLKADVPVKAPERHAKDLDGSDASPYLPDVLRTDRGELRINE
jgi:hypothetical protein